MLSILVGIVLIAIGFAFGHYLCKPLPGSDNPYGLSYLGDPMMR